MRRMAQVATEEMGCSRLPAFPSVLIPLMPDADHGDGISNDDESGLWQYQDPSGRTIGDYSADKLLLWATKGFFPSGLQVRSMWDCTPLSAMRNKSFQSADCAACNSTACIYMHACMHAGVASQALCPDESC